MTSKMTEKLLDWMAIWFGIWGFLTIVGFAFLFASFIPSTTHYEAPAPDERIIIPEGSHPALVYATITAYTSSIDETDEDPWTTASGSRPGPGTIACPAKWDFGTIVEIEGVLYRCEDRMNSRYRGTERYDVWLESKEEALEWGKKELAIYIHQ